jgi:hypothetical protein
VSDAARPPGALDVDLLTECAWRTISKILAQSKQ